MHRRDFVRMGGVALIGSASFRRAVRAVATAPSRTHWMVRQSEGFDAITFLDALSGGALYTAYYADDITAFKPKLPQPVSSDIEKLWHEAGAEGFGLLGPSLCYMLSAGNDATLDTVLQALADPKTKILPSYRASSNWDEKNWAWFEAHVPRLQAIFGAMRDAGFSQFRLARIGPKFADRVADVQTALDGYDVVSLQEKLTGHAFDPTIQVVLLQFSKPHGIKVQGQTFLQAADYDTGTTVRIAAHEMLHPPVPMDGPAAKAALQVLGGDPLMTRIVREHDPRWGYTSLDGILNEDLVQALDQLISEALGVAHNPADRWRLSDDGMHVLAGGLYGLLRQDHWLDRGGSIDTWLLDAARNGRLAPAVLHPIAARVLERPVGNLWPLPAGS